MTPLVSLIAASVAFVGSHFVMSHPLRAGMSKLLGEKGFAGIYSLISLALIIWVGNAFRAVGPGGAVLWSGQGLVIWALASLLSFLAMVLLLASLKGNPALPDADINLARQNPNGAFQVTRHPMMWGFALWAISHILVMPSPRTLVTAGATMVLALVGARLQDGKKVIQMGQAWREWEAKTSYWPRWSKLTAIPPTIWIVAALVWMAASWLHIWLANVPAGLWRFIL